MLSDGRFYYALFMLLAFATFFVVRRLQPARLGATNLDWQQRLILALSAFSGGAFGAKLGAIAEAAPRDSIQLDWVTLFSDGKTIMTGMAGAYIAVELAKFVCQIRAKTGDVYAMPTAAGMCVGRWGCFFNGCCFGTVTNLPWAVDFSPIVSGLRHPTQIYESIFHLASAVLLWHLIRKQRLRHQLLKLYLIAYCVFRFLTEFIRPAETWFIGMTFYQLVAVGFSLFLMAQWYRDDQRMRATNQGKVASSQRSF